MSVATPPIETQRQAAPFRASHGGGPPFRLFGNDGEPEPWQPGRTPQRTYALGMMVGIGASSMFFLALVSASVVHRGLAQNAWMPFHLPSLLWLTSALAVASSSTLVRARRKFKAGDWQSFSRWWTITAVLGICFLSGQVLAWRQLVSQGVYLISNPSVSFFYVFTVAHGLHLLGGVIALFWISWRQSRGWRKSPGISRSTATSVAALYWHFVTVLWLFLFSFFLIGG
ncbi:MAG TPA: cytochrome c oxidase subunit 3 [Candidatus Sulfotelmatobacter sp.]